MDSYEVVWAKFRSFMLDTWRDVTIWFERLEPRDLMLFGCFAVLMIVFLFMRRTRSPSRERRRSRPFFALLALVVLVSFGGSWLLSPVIDPYLEPVLHSVVVKIESVRP